MTTDDEIIYQLSSLAGVQTGYLDQQGEYKLVATHVLIAVLEALLNTPLKNTDDFLAAINSFSENPVIPDILLAWDGHLQIVLNRNHARHDDLTLHIASRQTTIILENTDSFLGHIDISSSDSQSFLSVSPPLPFGYHTFLDEELGINSLIISAPMSCPSPPQKGYGFALFAPTYAITDTRGLTEGDLSSLKLFGEMAAEHGAGLIATLPMFAEASAKDGASPGQSPYSPLSRSFFHEGYIDIAKLPGLDLNDLTQDLIKNTLSTTQIDGLAAADLAGKSDLIHPYLLKSVRTLLNTSDDHLAKQRDEFIDFCQKKQDLDRYANFRAATRLYGSEIDQWPHELQSGSLDTTILDQDLILVHKYAQFVIHNQLSELRNSLHDSDCGLLFDLPIGCSKNSFDVWAYKNHFSPNAMLGAPPDDFFQGGQNWGLPPLLPNYDRKNKYLFFRNMLHTSLLYADVLRIDHILGFSRLWWIPNGHPATEGAYVAYPSEELMAIACLEAHKTSTHLLGEDLGTVESEFRQKMDAHGISHMRVDVFEFKDRFAAGNDHSTRLNGNDDIVIAPFREFLYTDTHDTATFFGWLLAEDLRIRSQLCKAESSPEEELFLQRQTLVEKMQTSLLGENSFLGLDIEMPQHTYPNPNAYRLFTAVLASDALSETAYLVISLEDLIGEIKPQNIPGTGRLDGNFCRLIARRVEDILRDKNTEALLAMVRERRSLVISKQRSDNQKGGL